MYTKHVALILAIIIYLPLSIKTLNYVYLEYANDSWLLRVNRIGIIVTLILSALGCYTVMVSSTAHIDRMVTLPRLITGILFYIITRHWGGKIQARGLQWQLISLTVEDTYPYMETNTKKIFLIAFKHLFFGWFLTAAYSSFVVGLLFSLLINLSFLY